MKSQTPVHEVTEMIDEKAYEKGSNFKVGYTMKFKDTNGKMTSLEVTKIDRKNKRAWAREVVSVPFEQGMTHYGHLVDSSQEAIEQYGVPYCQECEVPLTEYANQFGDAKQIIREQNEGKAGGMVIEGSVN